MFKIFFILLFFISTNIFAETTISIEQKEQQFLIWNQTRKELSPFIAIVPTNLAEMKIKNRLLEEEYKTRNDYLRTLTQLYLKEAIAGNELDSDFKDFPEQNKIMAHFSSLLLEETISLLHQSKIPSLVKLMKRYDTLYPAGTVALFRVTGISNDNESPTLEKGGFHRTNKSIFMDITRTDSSEWVFIFLHELFHQLDETLDSSSRFFSQKENFEKAMRLTKDENSKLTTSDNDFLDEWVQAGLDRGLFAEFRAWNFCFQIYEDGKKEKLWGSIKFAEEILLNKKVAQKMSSFIYDYLDSKAQIKKESVLTRKIILKKMEFKREEFKQKLEKQ